jgi:predicted NUDIX family NTP pyrophosphohydrolase
MIKKISSKVIIFDPITNSILGAHPTGRKWKNEDGSMKKGTLQLPGGEIDENEDKTEAAIREIKEETGLSLKKNELTYLGKYEYLDYKDLEIFLYNLKNEKLDLKSLKCESYFQSQYGKMLPEINGFAMLNLEGELDMFIYSQQKVIQKVLKDHEELFSEF